MSRRGNRPWLAAAIAAIALFSLARPVHGTEPPPVLLVHGWHGIGDDTAQGSSMARLAERLDADGHRVAWAAGIGADPRETLEQAAATLGHQVADLARETGRPVVVVAHSYGGIVARAYLEGEGYAADFGAGVRVRGLVTLGTPMAGIDLWLPLLLVLGDPLHEPSVWQLTPAWMAEFNRLHRPRPDVRLVAVAGDARDQAWPLRLLPASDGVVTLSSALALDPRRFGHAERVTRDVHAPSAPTTALGWHDLLTHGPTYRGVVRPAILGAGGDGGTWPGAAAPSPDASSDRVWPVLGLARGPVERTGDGATAGRHGDAAAFLVAAPARAAGAAKERVGAPSPAGEGHRGDDSGAALADALALAPAGAATSADLPLAAAGAAAILSPRAAGSAMDAPGGFGFAAYASAVPHPVLRATSGAGALRLALEASDGRPLAPEDAWLEVLGAPSVPAAWRSEGGALAFAAALPPGAYVVRAGAHLDGRRMEALATVAVPDPGALRPRAAAWCAGADGAGRLRAELEVRTPGRYLIGMRGLDGAGRVAVATAGWRTLAAGANRVELAAAGDGARARRVVVEAMRDESGPIPAGGGDLPAGACRPVAGAANVASDDARR